MEAGLSGRQLAIALAAALLGLTLQLTQGQYSPFGVAVMAIALVIGIGGSLLRTDLRPASSRRFLVVLIVIQLFATLFTPADDSMMGRGGIDSVVHLIGFACLLPALGLIARGRLWPAKAGFAAAMVIFGLLGIWKLHSVPKPFIDVHPMHTEAADALLALENPYAITVADMYGASVNYYPPGTVIDGRVQYGFPYMPLSLMYSTPAYVLWGDPRVAYLLAMLATAGLIAVARPDRIGMLLGLLFLYTPASLYIVQMCWIEPLCTMLLAGTIVCAIRYPRVLPMALGLLIASKQYLPAALGFIPLLDRKERGANALKSILTAALVTLPLAVWDIGAFVNSTIAYQLKAPYRPDSLSFVAWWGYGKPDWAVPFWLSFIALGAGMAFCLTRRARGIHSFAAAFALCFFIFITLSKQAFINYHYLILAAACLAAATENCMQRGCLADTTLSDHAPPHPAHLPVADDRADRARPARAA